MSTTGLFTSETAMKSPCNSICRMSPSNGFCEGCFRTLDEIAHWAAFTEGRKREVWQQLALRADAQAVLQVQDLALLLPNQNG